MIFRFIFWLRTAVLAGLAGWYFFQASQAIRNLSPTYDEPFHLAAGYVMLEARDYRYQGLWHPPLAEMAAALPLKFFSAQERPLVERGHPAYLKGRNYEFSDFFLYRNRADADKMIRAGRWAGILFFLPLLAISLWFLARLFDEGAGFWAFVLLALEPNLLAHGTLITTDYSSAVMVLVSVAVFGLYLKYPSLLTAWGVGGAVSLAFLSKYTNAMALAPLALWPVLEWRRVRSNPLVKGHILAALLAFVLTFFVVYQGTNPGIYWEGFRFLFKQVERGRSSFFWGEYSNEGWLLYYPMVILLKTNLPLLAAGLGGLVLAVLRWRKTKESFLILAVLIPAATLAMASFSKVQIGLRYALAFYPFLIVLGSWALAWLEQRRPVYFLAAAALLALGLVSMKRASPWHLAYFNEFGGGLSGGWRYFTDSNNDWGQGMAELAKYVQAQGVSCLYLSYFGSADPNYYGLSYVPVGMVTNTLRPGNSQCRPEQEKKTYLAVSATNRQATYYANREAFKWLDSIKPEAFLAGSIFLYDLTQEAQARNNLQELLQPQAYR